MSFRGRLTLFFVAIVIVPIATLAVLVVEISEDSRDGKADARLASGLETARALYEQSLGDPATLAERIGSRPYFLRSIAAADRQNLASIAAHAVATAEVDAIEILDPEGATLASAGNPNVLAMADLDIEQAGVLVATVRTGSLEANAYSREVERLTGLGAAVVVGEEAIASTFDASFDPVAIGDRGTIELADGTLARLASLALEGGPEDARLFLLTPAEDSLIASSPLVLAALAAFLALAVGLIAFLLRSLQGQIAGMLAAAKSIGGGDFSTTVPVQGSDEMAGLAQEFNLMSGQLSEQMGQLSRQRVELDQSVRRIGSAFASGLDRTSLLGIVVETALTACDAESGCVVLSGHSEEPVSAGAAIAGPTEAALSQAAARALSERAVAAAEVEDVHAIAHPLLDASGEEMEPLGTIAVARVGTPFGPSEREVLRYLIGQASVSIENISLHERVSEQAVTDELTGLPNKRHLDDWIENETARLTRFGGELSLLLLDLDNFKSVNDTYGHQQGDRVLAAIGQILAEESREIDEPARYGGEEFVVALPETPTDGALEVAERIRARIAAETVPLADGNESLSTTVSIGVATMPAHAPSGGELIAAADVALYRAKRAGKNRVEVATMPAPVAPSSTAGKQRWWRS